MLYENVLTDEEKAAAKIAFGDRIRKAREKKKLTQEELAEKLGKSRQAVGRWESGTGFPEFDCLFDLCVVLDCDMVYLFGELDDTFSQAEQTAAAFTGLSVKAVRILHKWKAHSRFMSETLAAMIENKAFPSVVSGVANYKYQQILESHEKNARKHNPDALTVVLDETGNLDYKSDAALYHASLAFADCVRSLKSFVKA